jgi:transcriptional regulator with XRE-family HTH domain
MCCPSALLREWRIRRRLSQLDLTIGADVSSRHVSFIETGRSVPSRAMVLRLAAALEVPCASRTSYSSPPASQSNSGAAVLLAGVAPHLLEHPNALRIALHPDGLAPRIQNLAQWRHHVIERLRREAAVTGSTEISSLLAEMESYPGGFEETRDLAGIAVPLTLSTPDGQLLTFLSTVTSFGTALDITAAELSIEAFLPADEATAAVLR